MTPTHFQNGIHTCEQYCNVSTLNHGSLLLFFMVAVLELILTTVHTTTPVHYAVAHHAVVHRCIWVSFYSGFYVLLTVGAPKLKRCF
jgi:hypothetical protein